MCFGYPGPATKKTQKTESPARKAILGSLKSHLLQNDVEFSPHIAGRRSHAEKSLFPIIARHPRRLTAI